MDVSVVRDCAFCLQWHIDQAASCGATEQEVLEAVEVGIEMAAGGATVFARFALEVMDRALSQFGLVRHGTYGVYFHAPTVATGVDEPA